MKPFLPARFATLLAFCALAALPLRAAEDAGLQSVLPPPEFYSRQAETLQLTPEQQRSLRELFAGMNREFAVAQSNLTHRSRELEAAVQNTTLPAAEVAGRFQALLQAENRAKEIRFHASLVARRLLTEEQWQKARSLADAAARTRPNPAANSPDDVRAPLQKKLERIRALVAEVYPNGPPTELRARFTGLHSQVRASQSADADKLFDQFVADLEKLRDARPGPDKK